MFWVCEAPTDAAFKKLWLCFILLNVVSIQLCNWHSQLQDPKFLWAQLTPSFAQMLLGWVLPASLGLTSYHLCTSLWNPVIQVLPWAHCPSLGHWTHLYIMVFDIVIMQKSLGMRGWGSHEFQPALCVLQGSLVVPRVCDCSPGCSSGLSGLTVQWFQRTSVVLGHCSDGIRTG